jgi:hypothetical protein
MEVFDLRKYLGENKLVKENEGAKKEYTEDEVKYSIGAEEGYEGWVELAFSKGFEYDEIGDTWTHVGDERTLEEVNEDPNQKKYSWEEVKHELELNALMAARLIAHQAKGREHAVWEDLVADLMTMARRSKIPTHFDFLEDYYKSQKNNELGNTSSGSFFTGLTDIDGLLSAMNLHHTPQNS